MLKRYEIVALVGDKSYINEIKPKVDEVEGEIDYFEKDKEFKPKVRNYDIFVIDEIIFDDRVKFFKRVYRSLKNGAYMILTPKLYEEEMKQFLEDNGFVAINETEKYITAKKMHGWSSL